MRSPSDTNQMWVQLRWSWECLSKLRAWCLTCLSFSDPDHVAGSLEIDFPTTNNTGAEKGGDGVAKGRRTCSARSMSSLGSRNGDTNHFQTETLQTRLQELDRPWRTRRLRIVVMKRPCSCSPGVVCLLEQISLALGPWFAAMA